jgi:phage/plasmid-associated DNA primase
LVTFNRVFIAGTKEHDPDIAAKIITAERHLIASWLLDGAVRALRNGGYTIPSSHEIELHEWRRSANQVALFLEEMTFPAKFSRPGEGHDWTQCRLVYFAYKSWAESTGHRPMAENKFGSRMAQAGRESHPYGEPQRRYYPVCVHR